MGVGFEASGAPRKVGLVVAFALAILTLLLIAAPTHAGLGQANEANLIDEQRLSARVLELTVDTPAFAVPTRLHVNLPSGYETNPDRRWPVTYFMAGTMNRYSAFNDSLDGEELTANYPSIVVSPDANSGYWSDWYNAGSFGRPMYETFVIRQLIPLIDSRFRTVAKRSHRAIFGISMGGYGAMMLAARHPDLFGAAATLSGAVDSNLPVNGAVLSISSTLDGAAPDAIYGPRLTQEVRWRGHNPTDLAGNLRGLALQVRSANGKLNPGIGEGDDPNDSLSCAVEAGVYGASVNFHDALGDQGLPHVWRDYGDGCHSVQNFRREVVDTLATFSDVFANPPAPPARFEYRSIEPEFNVWGWRVEADPGRAVEFMRISAGASNLTLEGSGRTIVTTPARYRGIRLVDVNGKRKQPGSDGRLRFAVDLGRAHTVQQYTPGSATTTRRRTVTLNPHAVIRVARSTWRAGRLTVCARTIGGSVSRAKIKAAGRAVSVDLSGATTCATLPVRPRPERVTISGKDRFGHLVKASLRLR